MKLHDFLRSRFFPGRYIIQFSPVRTGSTLIFNILRELFPEKRIKKAHKYDKEFARLHTVCTVRHPLDCIASLIKIHRCETTPEAMAAAIRDFDQSGITDLRRIALHPLSVIFKYEEFMHNMAVVYDGLERSFGIKISEEQRISLNEKYSIESTLRTTTRLGEFSNWDPETMLHGNHISETRGASNVYQSFFNADQIAELESHYAEFLDFFGYRTSVD